ncbi:MAG: group 1 truncated hemoglobin [Alphaproteobacteria bacterium]|nr:group 1 truncated hemoglobin [Alphaproteobacteria bacterium]
MFRKILPLALTLTVFGCTDKAEDDTGGTDDTSVADDSAEVSLYEQLGGEEAINALTDAFLANVGNDTRINWMFANADFTNLKTQLHDQLCAASGGGCTYGGLDMATAHAGMAITDDQFNALVEDLLAALDALGIPYALDGSEPIDPLLEALVGMQGDIVEDADGTGVYFNRLGGYGTVRVLVQTFLGHVGDDSRINGFFATTDLQDLEDKLVEQICEATDGYCVYTGADMVTAHAGLCISDSDFDALVEDLLAACDDLGVPYALDGSEEIDGLLLALAGMRGDIVENCN